MRSPSTTRMAPRKRCAPTWCQRWSGSRPLSRVGARTQKPGRSEVHRWERQGVSRAVNDDRSRAILAGSDRVLFGAAYYHEYQPYDRLDVDLDLMQEAHFSVIRVGESVWSTWEPENGQFDLDWLEPVLDGAARRGISVILGTPTYAVPPWLARLYPEIAGERSTGARIPWGSRQEVDFTHPAFLF